MDVTRSEFDIIEQLFASLTLGDPRALGLKDDAAVLGLPEGREMVVTSDCLVAGVHFRPQDPPESIARKALRVNFSDLAGMGATPTGAFLAAAFPRDVCDDWLEAFALGLKEDIELFDAPLLGGDTVATPGPLTLTVTALGTVAKGRALRRSGAKAGDVIFVSGSLGDSAIGLKILSEEISLTNEKHKTYLSGRYLRPEPRTQFGAALSELDGVGGGMDVSDGLVQDLGHICAASGLGARVELDRLPLSAAAQSVLEVSPDLIDIVLTGGDDYELLFTVREDAARTATDLAKSLGLRLTPIGVIEAGQGVRVLRPDGGQWKAARTGYRHFDGAQESGD